MIYNIYKKYKTYLSCMTAKRALLDNEKKF